MHVIRVLPYASITIREAGKELTDFATLKEQAHLHLLMMA